MNKALFVFGTRPEAIKMAPVIKYFSLMDDVDIKICITGQHKEMLDQVMEFFDIEADYDLAVMKPNQNLYTLTSDIILGLKDVLEDFSPDTVYVHGDTTTSFVASLASFYFGTKICHVEAGLRTYNKRAPFPEEGNRTLTGRLADFHFAPTENAKENLIQEGINSDTIAITGNTVIDALYFGLNKLEQSKSPQIEDLKQSINFDKLREEGKKIILVTGHRRENHGEGFINICQALKEIANNDQAHIIYPVHLNPNVQNPVFKYLSNNPNITLIDPLPYNQFIWLMNQSYIILTDSGGIQEEAPSLGKPVLVMRETTERPEALDVGTVILVGANTEKISTEVLSLITDKDRYKKMSGLSNPYGDGNASKRIYEFMKQKLQK